MEYVTPLLDECHDRYMPSYLKAVSGLFEQCMHFVKSLVPPKSSEESLDEHAKYIALRVFEPHLDLYLQEELDSFTKYAEREVDEENLARGKID